MKIENIKKIEFCGEIRIYCDFWINKNKNKFANQLIVSYSSKTGNEIFRKSEWPRNTTLQEAMTIFRRVLENFIVNEKEQEPKPAQDQIKLEKTWITIKGVHEKRKGALVSLFADYILAGAPTCEKIIEMNEDTNELTFFKTDYARFVSSNDCKKIAQEVVKRYGECDE